MTHRYHEPPVTAIYPGSFNPFTIGHLSVVERASRLFDHIYVAIGINDAKKETAPVQQRLEAISQAVASIPGVSVVTYSGLTVEKARELGASFILRGVRTVADFQYEQQLADINRNISGIETVILFTLPQHSFISSSMVRELEHYGHDVSEFLPPADGR